MSESVSVEQKKELIKSPEFEAALKSGAERKMRIQTVLKEKNKNNYELFYDLMLRSRSDIQNILDLPKKQRKEADNNAIKNFKKQTSKQYKQVKELIYISEDDSMDENGIHVDVSKKLTKLVEQIVNTAQLLAYIGHDELNLELEKHGIKLVFDKLENTSEVFENEKIKEDMKGVFDESINIAKEVDGENNAIKVDIYENEVPNELRFDKDGNQEGIKNSDFCKLVALQTKVLKAEKEDEEAKEKTDEAITKEAEQRTFDMARAEIIREKVMELGFSDVSEGNENPSEFGSISECEEVSEEK